MPDDPWAVVSTEPVSATPKAAPAADPWAVVKTEPAQPSAAKWGPGQYSPAAEMIPTPNDKPTPPEQPQGIVARANRATAESFEGPYGMEEGPAMADSPILRGLFRSTVKPASKMLDMASRPFVAAGNTLAGAFAGVAEDVGMRPSRADAFERDLREWARAATVVAAGSPLTGPEGPLPEPKAPSSGLGLNRIDASENAKSAIKAGFAIPPADASVGHIGQTNLTNVAAGEAGKIKLGQLASAKNQPLVNVYAQKDLGLEPGTVLTPKVFDDVRKREGQVYQQVVQAVPEVDLARDPKFREAVGYVGKRSEETERLFPSTKEPPGVTELRDEMLTHARGGTQAVMNYIADLRFKATQNFQTLGNAMAHRMGAAQREAATALEDAMERSVQKAPDYYRERLESAKGDLQRAKDVVEFATKNPGPNATAGGEQWMHDLIAGKEAEAAAWEKRLADATAKNGDNQTLVDQFRKARQTMAKSYDVQAVTNVSTGDVSATGLGRLLQQGKPLSGNLKLIADSANSFHRAFQNPAAFGGVEPLSVIDAATAGILASQGHIAPAAGILGRPWLRGRVLSPSYQQSMISDPAKRGMSPGPQTYSPAWPALGVLSSQNPYPPSPAAPYIDQPK